MIGDHAKYRSCNVWHAPRGLDFSTLLSIPGLLPMDFELMIGILNELLFSEKPETFNSSWIQKRAPQCYRFIRKNIRTVLGAVDWDRVTWALERRFQRRWVPRRMRHSSAPYRNRAEVRLVLEKYRAND
jgi:hypothetical protein